MCSKSGRLRRGRVGGRCLVHVPHPFLKMKVYLLSSGEAAEGGGGWLRSRKLCTCGCWGIHRLIQEVRNIRVMTWGVGYVLMLPTLRSVPAWTAEFFWRRRRVCDVWRGALVIYGTKRKPAGETGRAINTLCILFDSKLAKIVESKDCCVLRFWCPVACPQGKLGVTCT